MNNIKKCKSSNIKNFFCTTLLQTFAIIGTLNLSPKGVHNNGSWLCKALHQQISTQTDKPLDMLIVPSNTKNTPITWRLL